jgi:hypothetical protein
MQIYRRGIVMLLTIALLSIFTKISWAADSQLEDMQTPTKIGTTTKGWEVFVYQYNGRLWNTLTAGQKELFIAGLQEGVTAYYAASDVGTTSRQSEYMNVKDSYFAKGFGPPELAGIIEDIYKDKANIRLPISEVLRVAVRKTAGLFQYKTEELLSGLRKQFSNLK